ncbi:UBE2C isoform 6 [Pan troglodytes]|uniref:Ubiquitin conjugating enzyme E2 C n=4 Tax=Homininae TaxID=207598 RepID=A0A087WVK1_HUMAN|nr:ubiquitin-conjugating enzyme E2 C isoform 6 [Homo sapiens]KAI2595091.1 ubiquitin conjugating enzyme E2 C [Homo sapiens]KAI4005796.1 ubiquitin conjugating enzyme E2 C [Homo sapiens]PNI59827.1 UBE2C isoform 6 [Pan troglodytes]|eukprot:NP_001268670.1 ubiquitin-conjugating enzyme E2 C isoform 6 [Homo sapiens]
MASQNRDPAATSVAAARKGAEPSGGAARGPVGKRLQQELMTLMAVGSIRTSSTVCLLSGPRETQDSSKPLVWGLGWDMRLLLELTLQLFLQMPEPNIDSPLNTHAAELWKNPTAFKKYLQETYSKQVTSQEP